MAKLHIVNGIILTCDEANPVLHGHTLTIEGESILSILPAEQVDTTQGKVIDAAGKVVMPGFINAHHHFYSTLVRGLGKAKSSTDFNQVLENLWWRLDKKLKADDVYYSALISLLNAIRQGTTTIIDHHASPGSITGSLSQIAAAVKQCGIRANLCYEVSDRDGDAVALAGIKENAEWLKQCRAEQHPLLRELFGLHAAFTLSNKTLELAAQEGRELEAGFHIHVAEAASDEEHSLRTHGKRVVRRLADFGILNYKSIAAHCVHIDKDEMALLAETDTAVVHNPQSNLNNAVGIADIVGLNQAGVLTGLGTDAMTVRMPEELRVAVWAQHYRHDPSQGFMEAAHALLMNNGIIANRYWNCGLGVLKAGNAADVVLIDYFAPTPLDASTWIGHVIYGLSQSAVDTTICNGSVLMQDKQLCLDMDEEAVSAHSRECAEALWKRF